MASRRPYLLNSKEDVPLRLHVHDRQRPIDFEEIVRNLAASDRAKRNGFLLMFWHDPYEMTHFSDDRAIINDTTDTAIARSLDARYVGA